MDRDDDLWDQKAKDWHIQVGEQGDRNRRFNSDPFLWRYLGEVEDLSILDAGCGTGYLSRLLQQKGARVTAVDFSPKMVDLARELSNSNKGPSIQFYVDSCSQLSQVSDTSVDKIVSNYVLMDLEDLQGAARAFFRVLKPGGIAVIVITHPCFPQSDFSQIREDGSVHYRWDFPYYESRKLREGPWKHFTSDFTWYHRPIRDYFQEFLKAGFNVLNFDEPVVPDPPPEDFDNQEPVRNYRMRPNSVIFLLQKP
ncbi:MAG: class I SAM-dependent methyltransferase [Candidatus Kariarchaeaceae archaeon]|jgi:SAM-dependent methyltransferase